VAYLEGGSDRRMEETMMRIPITLWLIRHYYDAQFKEDNIHRVEIEICSVDLMGDDLLADLDLVLDWSIV
jgi:hypothetical protein